MSKFVTSLLIASLLLITQARAATYVHVKDGKQVEITKGAAIKILALDSKATVLVINEVELNEEKGTLRNKKTK